MTRTGGETRRHALIEEAIRAFGREGYSGASLEQIATAVGIRKQTLLYYFPTKDALLEACLQAAGQRVADEIAEALEGKETYWDRAEAVIHAVFALAEEWPEFPRDHDHEQRSELLRLPELASPNIELNDNGNSNQHGEDDNEAD